MNRRDFLKHLGLGGVALATPKFIFDVGANLYKMEINPIVYERPLIDMELIDALRKWAQETVDDIMTISLKEYAHFGFTTISDNDLCRTDKKVSH